MTCVIPSKAGGITPADITLTYIHCCYTFAELYLLAELRGCFGEIFRKCLNY